MVTYVLDSSAVLRYLDGEAGSDRVAEIIKGHLAGKCEAVMPCPALGRDRRITFASIRGRREPWSWCFRDWMRIRNSGGRRGCGPSGPRRADQVQNGGSPMWMRLEWNSRRLPERVFVTADFDFKAAKRDVTIEFLPAK